MLSNLVFLYVIPLTTHVSFFCHSSLSRLLCPSSTNAPPINPPFSFLSLALFTPLVLCPLPFLLQLGFLPCPSRPFPLSFLPPPQVISGPGLHPHWVGGVSLLIVTVINISKEGSWDTENLCTGWLTLLAISVFFSFDQPLCSSLSWCLFSVTAGTPAAAPSDAGLFLKKWGGGVTPTLPPGMDI